MNTKSQLNIQQLHCSPYEQIWQQMQQFTQNRSPQTADEIWLTEHFPVYTLGLNARTEHLLNAKQIPVVLSDRGGQVTYHAPGQAIVYVLFDLQRMGLNATELVTLLEDAMIATLASFQIAAQTKANARGVYVGEKKIGSIGLRIKKKGCYHGLSLNNQMDLTPFQFINPCGFENLQMTQLFDFGVDIQTAQLAQMIASHLTARLK